MKSAIHPNYNTDSVVTCSCGNSFTTGSTMQTIHVEVCSKCHPFWTGDEKLVDMEGKVDQFIRKRDVGEKARQERIKKLKEKVEREKERQGAPKSLKDMLKALQ